MKKFVLSAMLVGVFTLIPTTTYAGECYSQPIIEKDLRGKYNISAFIRDNACQQGTSVVGTITKGTVVDIIAENDGWYKVKADSGQEGWTWGGLITIVGESVSSDSESNDRVKAYTAKRSHYTKKHTVNKSALFNRVKGKLLLQVEDRGRIWYVNPTGTTRVEVTQSQALPIFRSHALGITNANLDKIPLVGSNNLKYKDFRSKLAGRLLLQVEDKGKVWYVIPDTLERVRVTPETVMDIFRTYSLGITNSDLDSIATE